MKRKNSRDNVGALLQSDTNKDILFIGTSEVVADVLTIKLWEHHGYASCILFAGNDGIRRDLGVLRTRISNWL